MWALFLFWMLPAFGILSFAVAVLLIGQTKRKSKESSTDWRTQETWEDYPTVNYDKVHTYCSVTFEDNSKIFYYRTRNPELKVGDLVYVSVGHEKRVGRIVKMKEYLGYFTPYPLERTKHIIDKIN